MTSKSREKAQVRIRDISSGTAALFAFAYLAAIALLVVLIYNGGVWNVLGNTRLLSPLIDGGIVALTDADNGLLVPEGVPDLAYYVSSQDPVDWLLVLLAAGIFLGIWALKAVQFHGLARFAGLTGGFGEHGRAMVYGHGIGRILPFRSGDVAAAAVLEGQGVPIEQASGVVGLARAFVVFEILVFAFVGLLLSGVTTWIGELFWPCVILLGAHLLTRRGSTRAEHRAARRESLSEARATIATLAASPRVAIRLAVLSVLAFFLLELAAYIISQAFTSSNVILNVEFTVITMGLVGGYLASLIQVTPGGLGQFEWGMATALYAGGLGFPECVTLALLVTAVRYVAGSALFAALMLGPGVESSAARALTLYDTEQATGRAAVPSGVEA